MSGHLQPIQLDSYKPLRELVCENIRQAIIDGTFSPGERLMEIQLADEMGVSRTPVREAIRKLEQEGFVVMIPRRGTYVADISIKDITEIYEIRISLDILAAGLAAERITDEELQTLNGYLLEIGQHIANNDMNKIVAVDTAFHDVLYTASRNERLRTIINNLREQMYRYRLEYLKDTQSHDRLVEEHQKIVNAIIEKNKEEAVRLIQEHIYIQELTVIKKIQEQEN